MDMEKVQEYFHTLEEMESIILSSSINAHQLHVHMIRLNTFIENLMDVTFQEKDQSLKPLYATLELRARTLLKQIKKKLVINN